VVGDHPILLGLDKCNEFRDKVPPLERMLGSSGMFNTGTNLVTHLLKQNCEIPERREQYGPHQSKESYGMRWQVPVSENRRNENRRDEIIEFVYALCLVLFSHGVCRRIYTNMYVIPYSFQVGKTYTRKISIRTCHNEGCRNQ
jgi:hypothetical protein